MTLSFPSCGKGAIAQKPAQRCERVQSRRRLPRRQASELLIPFERRRLETSLTWRHPGHAPLRISKPVTPLRSLVRPLIRALLPPRGRPAQPLRSTAAFPPSPPKAPFRCGKRIPQRAFGNPARGFLGCQFGIARNARSNFRALYFCRSPPPRLAALLESIATRFCACRPSPSPH